MLQELIKVRGWQVSPAELEAQLLLHPSIADAAVVGVPSISHPRSDEDAETELPRAYVVRVHKPRMSQHENLSELEIKAYLSTRLAKYKALDGGVRFVDAIPRNSTGKILRKDLKERAAIEARTDKNDINHPTTPNHSNHDPPLTISIVPAPDGLLDPEVPSSGLSQGSTVSDSEHVQSENVSQQGSSDTDYSTTHGDAAVESHSEMKATMPDSENNRIDSHMSTPSAVKYHDGRGMVSAEPPSDTATVSQEHQDTHDEGLSLSTGKYAKDEAIVDDSEISLPYSSIADSVELRWALWYV